MAPNLYLYGPYISLALRDNAPATYTLDRTYLQAPAALGRGPLSLPRHVHTLYRSIAPLGKAWQSG